MFPLIFFILGIIAALIHISRLKKRTTGKVVELLLVYLMVFSMGLDGLFAGFFQAFFGKQTAAGIGFTYSPFEFEIAMANTGIAIAALCAIFWRGKYMFGPIIANSVFIYGAAYGHFVQQAKGDSAAYNTGVFLWVGDIIIPTIILILAISYYMTVVSKEKNPKP